MLTRNSTRYLFVFSFTFTFPGIKEKGGGTDVCTQAGCASLICFPTLSLIHWFYQSVNFISNSFTHSFCPIYLPIFYLCFLFSHSFFDSSTYLSVHQFFHSFIHLYIHFLICPSVRHDQLIQDIYFYMYSCIYFLLRKPYCFSTFNNILFCISDKHSSWS